MKDRKAGRLSLLFTLPLLQANTAWYPTAFQITALYPDGWSRPNIFFVERYSEVCFKVKPVFLVSDVSVNYEKSPFLLLFPIQLEGGPNEKKHII